jgi:hypothetical protein
MVIPSRRRQQLKTGIHQFLSLLLQRAAAIRVVAAVGQKVAILRIGDEQQPEQDGQRHPIGEVKLLDRGRGEASRLGDGGRELRQYLLVDPLA